jgi:GT2 family glycosyltransferase
MTLKVIVVAYERPIPLMILISSFLVQTDGRWQLHIIYDGPVPSYINDVINFYNDKRIYFTHSDKRNGRFGHPNRRQALMNLTGETDDYVLLTNDDNYYVPTFIEQMLSMTDDNTGIVFCNTVHSYINYAVHESSLFECGIDMGAFIVKYPIAKKIGFNYMHETADGRYATECSNYCVMNDLKTIHVKRPLFVHN